MKKHKLKEETYLCIKCNNCICISCADKSMYNKLAPYWERYILGEDTINKYNNKYINNSNLILKISECTLSDDEYIIKNIIE